MDVVATVENQGLKRDHALTLLREMLRIRRFEEKCAELYSLGKIRGFLHLYIGEEAVAAGAMQALTPEDAIVTTYREHGHALARGVPMGAVMAEMFGKANGCSRGRGGSMHLFDSSRRFYGGYAIVSGGLPIAVGLALADKMQNRNRVTACFFGYGVKSEAVDGMDVMAVEEATRKAVEFVRRSSEPYLIEYRTYRFRAHSMYDAELYRSKEEVEEWKARCPVTNFTALLRERGELTEVDIASIEGAVAREIEEAVAFAEAGEWEPVEDLLKDVYTTLR